ncbi:hypothetical protein Tco_0938983, partial [Tanacetum coccineum]
DSDTPGARSTPSDSTAPLPPNHLLTHASPTLVPILYRTARMVVRVLPAMSSGLSASIAEVAAMSDSAFRKELVKGDEEEEDNKEEVDEEEDEEIKESSNSNSESEDVKDEGPTKEDEDPATGDDVLATRDEGLVMGVECLNLGEDEALPEGQQRAALVVETVVGEPLGLGYGPLRRQEIAFREGRMPSVYEVGQSSRSVPEPERPERVSALRQPTVTTWIDTEDVIAYIDGPAYPPPALPV